MLKYLEKGGLEMYVREEHVNPRDPTMLGKRRRPNVTAKVPNVVNRNLIGFMLAVVTGRSTERRVANHV
jgi:hypothetical protein